MYSAVALHRAARTVTHLVHGVDVGELHDAEEEHAGMLGDELIADPRLVNGYFGLLSLLRILSGST